MSKAKSSAEVPIALENYIGQTVTELLAAFYKRPQMDPTPDSATVQVRGPYTSVSQGGQGQAHKGVLMPKSAFLTPE